MRLSRGWTVAQAVGEAPPPPRPSHRGKSVHCAGRRHASRRALAAAYGLSEALVAKRLRAGWTPEQAAGAQPPPPRFRNQVGGARARHWVHVEIDGERELPGAEPGSHRLYVIRHRLSGKEYVGITNCDLKTRFRGHVATMKKGVRSPLYNAMRRYGHTAFEIVLVRDNAQSRAELHQQEQAEIATRGTLGGGYNSTPGGDAGSSKPIVVGGERFASRGAAAGCFGVDPTVFNIRVGRLGWTPEEAAGLGQRRKYARRPVKIGRTTYPSLKSAAEALGLNYRLVHDRLVQKNWTERQALELESPPATVRMRGVSVSAFGRRFRSIAACARHFGVKPATLQARLAREGSTVVAALRALGVGPGRLSR
jgi:hypothetical protein